MAITTITPTQAQAQVLKDKAIEIYRQHDQLWQDYRVLPEGEQDRQSLLFRRLSDHLWDQYGKAWGEYLKVQEVLDKEAGLKANKARAEKVRQSTCMSCFQITAANGTCGC